MSSLQHTREESYTHFHIAEFSKHTQSSGAGCVFSFYQHNSLLFIVVLSFLKEEAHIFYVLLTFRV